MLRLPVDFPVLVRAVTQAFAAGRDGADADDLKEASDETVSGKGVRAMRFVLLLSASLCACATMTDSSGPIESHAAFCAVARPFLWSNHDTDETIRQAKEYNAAGVVPCRLGAAQLA